MPTWVNEVQAGSTVLGGVAALGIAGLGAWIARRQAHTARQKLRLDLFPLRYAVYTEFIDSVVITLHEHYDAVTDDTTRRLSLKLCEARFLFDRTLFDYLNQIETTILQYRYGVVIAKDENIRSSSRYQEIKDDKIKDTRFLLESLIELAARAEPYLKVQEDLSFSLLDVKPKFMITKPNIGTTVWVA